MKRLLNLRILETVFLVELICTFYRGEPQIGGTPILMSFEVLTLGIQVHITASPEPAVLSTAILGYVFSFLATLFLQRDQSTWKWNLSIALSVLGFISLFNEALRLFLGYDFQLMLTLPALLVLLDWLLYKQELTLARKAAEVGTEAESTVMHADER